jgi:hypothetical protein
MSTAHMTYEKENEGCGEQCPRNDEGYRIDFHGGRFRIRNVSAGSIVHKRATVWREPFFSVSTTRVAFALLCFRLCLGLFERTQSQSANAMLSKSASGVVPKLGRPNLAQYA